MHIQGDIPFRYECHSDECAEHAIFSQNRLPWQRPLRYRNKRSRSIICTQNAFIRWKDCENLSSTSRDIWQNTPNPTWTRNTISICYLVHRNYWTDLHQNFTRYSGIRSAIKSCIYKALVHSFSDRQSNEWRLSILTLPKCSKINWLPKQLSLGYHKTFVSFVIPINVATYAESWRRSV